MGTLYRRAVLEIEGHSELVRLDRVQAAQNVKIAACIADGPTGKKGMVAALVRTGKARGIVLHRNVRRLEHRLRRAGFAVRLRLSAPFRTNHGGRPFGGDEWTAG